MVVRHCVLVIDSDERSRASTVGLLSQRGIATLEAADIPQLRSLLASGTPAVVIIEPSLATVDGFELARTITSSRNGSFPAVILASKKVRGKAAHVRAKEVGACMFVERPTYDRVLLEAAIRLLEDLPGYAQHAARTGSHDEVDPSQQDISSEPPQIPMPDSESVDLADVTDAGLDDWVDAAFSFDDAPAGSPATSQQTTAEPDPAAVAVLDSGPDEAARATLSAPEEIGAPEGLGEMPPPLSQGPEAALEESIQVLRDQRANRVDESQLNEFQFEESATSEPLVFPTLGDLQPEPTETGALTTGGFSPPPDVAISPKKTRRRRKGSHRAAIWLVVLLVSAGAAAAAWLLYFEPLTQAVPDNYLRAEARPIGDDLRPIAQIAGFYQTSEPQSQRLVPVEEEPAEEDVATAKAAIDERPAEPPPQRRPRTRTAPQPRRDVAARVVPPPTRRRAATPTRKAATEKPAPPPEKTFETPSISKPAETSVAIVTPPPVEPTQSEPASSETTRSEPVASEIANAATANQEAAPQNVPASADSEPASTDSPEPIAEFSSGDGTDEKPEELTPEPFDEPAAPAAAPTPTFVVPPRVIASSKTAPRLPPLAKKRRLSGRVLLEVIVMPNGSVGPIRVISESPKKIGFGKAAINAVKRWKFEPGSRNGQPAALPIQFQVVFSPNGG